MKMPDSAVKTRIFVIVLFVLAFFVSATFPLGTEEHLDFKGTIFPDILFCLSIVLGILCPDEKEISIIALVFGVVSDVFITPPMHLSPVLFFLGAYFSGRAVSAFTRINALSAALSAIPFFFIRAATGTIYLLSQNPEVKLRTILGTTVFPEFVENFVACFFVYIVVNLLYKWFKRRFYIM